ncbi:DHA2 family efflux MFS transporter permease subunit [Brevibacterium oceani]|uniref:DHA2 family efflux MFS transporter permease subunit n=1 Tax=Brevibacterium oceani TaxID=358099 RepID=UPI001B31C312|nr:DHA2 family efflux MFS transporter permease subunit [Brevibacterium oceani]
MTHTHAPEAVETARSPRPWLALIFLALAEFIVVLDASIVNIALPVLGTELTMDNATLAWVITAYVLPFGALLLLGGRLADRCGHRRLFLIGAAGFVIGSALAGLSATAGMLLAARAVQGASAALLAPAALALLTIIFPDPADRGKALGIWGGVAGLGSGAGVLLGGLLTSSFGWESVFFINVPIGLAAFVATVLLIGRDTTAPAGRLDLAGAVTITGALVAMVAALSAAERTGVFSLLPIVLAVVALMLAAAFVLVERRSPQPLVPLDIFGNRHLRSGNIVMLLLGAAMVGLFYALALFLGQVLEYSTLTIGLSQLPLATALILVAGIAPRLSGRLGAGKSLSMFSAILAGGLVWLAAAPADAHFISHLLGPTVIIGIGIGGTFVIATQLAMHGVSGHETGLASGLVNTSQQIGGALGIALLGAVASTRTADLVAGGEDQQQALAGGFSWLFAGAAAVALIGAVVSLAARTGKEA